MSETRLAAFARGIVWPPSDLIETEGERERGWDGPYLAGTYLPVGIVGRNLADDWGWREHYPLQTDDTLIAARDYYLAHADLFQAQRWRAVQFDRQYQPGGDGEQLKADIAALLDRLAAAEGALRALVATEPAYTMHAGVACCYCGKLGYDLAHQPGCPWLLARALAAPAAPEAGGE